MRLQYRCVYMFAACIAVFSACNRGAATASAVKIVGADTDDTVTALAKKSTFYLHPIFCTATLVDVGVPGYERRVLTTAAHCDSRDGNKKVAKFNLKRKPDAFAMNVSMYPHPQYDQDERNDIAILILDKPAPDDWVPVPIVTAKPASGQKVVLAGFGDLAYKGDWPTEALAVNSVIDSFRADSNLIIYKTPSGKGAECHGDSGGPMFIESNGALQVIGATHGGYSGMNNRDECVSAGAYTYIAPFLPWIKQTIEKVKGGKAPDGGVNDKEPAADGDQGDQMDTDGGGSDYPGEEPWGEGEDAGADAFGHDDFDGYGDDVYADQLDEHDVYGDHYDEGGYGHEMVY